MNGDLLGRLRETIGDRYAIEREIGAGGMATVFLAIDRKHARPVALKVMSPGTAVVGGAARFQREIQIAARLNHPNILALIDSGEAGDLRYYVMPFVEGESLRQRLTREGQLAVGEAIRITRAVAAGLAHAHERGLVHRDIKPENILLSGDSVLVADFGIARLAESADNLTSAGLSLGSPHYMSPEQAGGTPVDARSDEYALACVLYELLTGYPPFQGVSWQVVLSRHAMDPVPPIRTVRQTVPPQAERAIQRAMAKVPADRFGTVTEFAAALPGETEVERYATGARPPMSMARRVPARRLALAGAGVVVVLAAVLAWRAVRAPATPADQRILLAVLPLENAGDSADAHFVDGLSEEITARLTRVRGIGVLARNNTIQYRTTGQTVQEIGRTLRVRYVLDGTVRWAPAPEGGRMVRVTPSLVDVATGTVVCCESYDGRMANVFDLQTRIAEGVVGALQVRLGEGERAALRASATGDAEAYRLYTLGRFHWKRRTSAGLAQAVAAFEQALERDSTFARAWSGLADAYVLYQQYGVPGMSSGEAFARARRAATRAIDLDPSLAEAHASLGEIATYADWDWAAAERQFRQAIVLDPDYATGRQWYAELLAITGRHEEALAQARRATELDPTSAVVAHAVTLPLIGLRRLEEAIRQYHRVLELDPAFGYAHVGLTWVYVALGDLPRALEQLHVMGDTTALMQAWARAAVDASLRPTARQVAARYEEYLARVPLVLRAPIYAGIGDADRTIAALETAAEARDVAILGIGFLPIYDWLRPDPRFQALIGRLKLN